MNIRNVCTNKSALNNKKNPQQSSLISLQIQIQTLIQQKMNCEEKRTENTPTAQFYSKKK